jgi:hypothetical protein
MDDSRLEAKKGRKARGWQGERMAGRKGAGEKKTRVERKKKEEQGGK